MRMNSIALTPPVRDEYELTVLPAKDPADVEVRLPLFARLAEMTLMRRLAFLVILAVLLAMPRGLFGRASVERV